MNNQYKANVILTVVVLAVAISGLYSVTNLAFKNVNSGTLFPGLEKSVQKNDLPQFKPNRSHYQKIGGQQASQNSLIAGTMSVQIENPTIQTRRTVASADIGKASNQAQGNSFASSYSYQASNNMSNARYAAQQFTIPQENGFIGHRGRRAGMMAGGATDPGIAYAQFNRNSLLNGVRNTPDMILPDLRLNTSAFANEEVMMRMDEFPGDPGSNEDLPISGNLFFLLIFAIPYALLKFVRR